MKVLAIVALCTGCYRGAAPEQRSQPASPEPAASARPAASPTGATSTAAADALLERAERAFEDGDLVVARTDYTRLANDARLGDYARYKLAWVHANLGDWRAALELFTAIATTGHTPQLRSSAARDSVVAYANVGRADKAMTFVSRIDPANKLALARRLADAYADTGKLDSARDMLRQVAQAETDPDRRCATHVALVKLVAPGARAQDVVAELEQLAASARQAGVCAASADDVVAELAEHWFREYQAIRGDATPVRRMLDLAEQLATTTARRARAAQLRAQLP